MALNRRFSHSAADPRFQGVPGRRRRDVCRPLDSDRADGRMVTIKKAGGV